MGSPAIARRPGTRTQPGSLTPPGAAAGRGWLMLAVLLLGQFMCIIDVLVVNVAMPSIGTSLHASGASLQLVVGGYTVAYAMLLITGARLGDRYGRRRAYLAGVITFTAASLACTLAPDSQLLVAFRFAQGAGAAALVPQVFSLIQLRFTGPARARALSAYAAVLSAGAVAGLVLGGVVVSANLFGLGWRPVFGINVPIGIALALAVPRLIPADEPAGSRRLDLAGLLVAGPAVLLIVLPLVLGHEAGWPAWSFGCLAAGILLAGVFVLVERRVAVRGGDPLLNLDVLRAPGLPSGLTALAVTQLTYGGLLFACTLYLQAGLGDSALRAGVTYVPMAATFGLVGYCWRRLPGGLRRVVVPVGLTVSAVAYLGIAACAHGGAPGGSVALTLAVAGLGLGLSVGPLLTQALAHVPLARAADASGLLTTIVQFGQLMGVAVLGSVYLARAAVHPAPTMPGAALAGTAMAGPPLAGLALAGTAMAVTAGWLALVSVAGLPAALAVALGASRRSAPRGVSRRSASN